MALLEPKELVITDQSGKVRTFLISKFPAVQGREIIAKYPISNMPKLGDYNVSEEIMLKLMSFVAVPMPQGEPLRLTTRVLVDNHCGDWEALAAVEWAMIQYNCSFFQNARISTFLDGFVQNIWSKISEMSTVLSGLSSQAGKPR